MSESRVQTVGATSPALLSEQATANVRGAPVVRTSHREPRARLERALLPATLALLLASTVSCRKHEAQSDAPVAASASASAPAAPHVVTNPDGTSGYLVGPKPQLFHVPVGPRLAIVPGKGLGPVRFGATRETLERLLGGKCTVATETLCRMASHAIDFVLKDGVVEEMRVQGEERKIDPLKDDTWGIFNGRFMQGGSLGMYAQFVQESVGQPKRVEKFDTPVGPNPTVERHYYDNMVLEYDRLENGNVVLAGVILTRPAPGTEPPEEDATGAAPSATGTAKGPTKPVASAKAPTGSDKGSPARSPH
jgi:hypothetical protein